MQSHTSTPLTPDSDPMRVGPSRAAQQRREITRNANLEGWLRELAARRRQDRRTDLRSKDRYERSAQANSVN